MKIKRVYPIVFTSSCGKGTVVFYADGSFSLGDDAPYMNWPNFQVHKMMASYNTKYQYPIRRESP